VEKVKKLGFVLALVACFMLALSVVALAADKYPNGCADCHKSGDAKMSLQAMVKQYAKHPPVSATADLMACLKCHKAGTKLALNTKMHDDHAKAKVTCDACHGMPPTVKNVKGVK
jgi:hypothetical protein